MLYTVRVPIWETGSRFILGQVQPHASNAVNPDAEQPAVPDLMLTPRDSDGDGMPDGWESHYGGHPTNMNANADNDGDGMRNLHEQIAGTSPVDSNSLLTITHFSVASNGGVSFAWQSAPARFYALSVATGEVNAAFLPLVTGIAADPPTNSYASDRPGSAAFYRIEVAE
jgi:hypothetical protein